MAGMTQCARQRGDFVAERQLPGEPRLERAGPIGLLVACLIAITVMACGSSTPSSPGFRDPVHLMTNGSTGDFYDQIVPGTPFEWLVRIVNDAGQDATVDDYQLIDKPAALEVIGATVWANAPAGFACSVPPVPVDAGMRSALASKPLVGSSIGASDTAPWTSGGCLVFLLQVPSANDYAVSGVRLRYHVGGRAFETILPASLEVCAGATVPPGSTCPFASASPSR
jgi:hypothetical protein